MDVLGLSTGGSIAQHFAADHPDLVHRLVLHSSAHTLKDTAKKGQMRMAQMARQRRWTTAIAAKMGISLPDSGIKQYLRRPINWALSLFEVLFYGVPKDPSDLVVTILAEDTHDFRERLSEIQAPTLVIAGDKDPHYTEELFRQTAAGLPHAELILYQGMGHLASGEQFDHDLRAFLNEDTDTQKIPGL